MPDGWSVGAFAGAFRLEGATGIACVIKPLANMIVK